MTDDDRLYAHLSGERAGAGGCTLAGLALGFFGRLPFDNPRQRTPARRGS